MGLTHKCLTSHATHNIFIHCYVLYITVEGADTLLLGQLF
jgi:hypothetical protein